jgi:hypothetical protein
VVYIIAVGSHCWETVARGFVQQGAGLTYWIEQRVLICWVMLFVIVVGGGDGDGDVGGSVFVVRVHGSSLLTFTVG